MLASGKTFKEGDKFKAPNSTVMSRTKSQKPSTLIISSTIVVLRDLIILQSLYHRDNDLTIDGSILAFGVAKGLLELCFLWSLLSQK